MKDLNEKGVLSIIKADELNICNNKEYSQQTFKSLNETQKRFFTKLIPLYKEKIAQINKTADDFELEKVLYALVEDLSPFQSHLLPEALELAEEFETLINKASVIFKQFIPHLDMLINDKRIGEQFLAYKISTIASASPIILSVAKISKIAFATQKNEINQVYKDELTHLSKQITAFELAMEKLLDYYYKEITQMINLINYGSSINSFTLFHLLSQGNQIETLAFYRENISALHSVTAELISLAKKHKTAKSLMLHYDYHDKSHDEIIKVFRDKIHDDMDDKVFVIDTIAHDLQISKNHFNLSVVLIFGDVDRDDIVEYEIC